MIRVPAMTDDKRFFANAGLGAVKVILAGAAIIGFGIFVARSCGLSEEQYKKYMDENYDKVLEYKQMSDIRSGAAIKNTRSQ